MVVMSYVISSNMVAMSCYIIQHGGHVLLYHPTWWPCLVISSNMVAMSCYIIQHGGHVLLYHPTWCSCRIRIHTLRSQVIANYFHLFQKSSKIFIFRYFSVFIMPRWFTPKSSPHLSGQKINSLFQHICFSLSFSKIFVIQNDKILCFELVFFAVSL